MIMNKKAPMVELVYTEDLKSSGLKSYESSTLSGSTTLDFFMDHKGEQIQDHLEKMANAFRDKIIKKLESEKRKVNEKSI